MAGNSHVPSSYYLQDVFLFACQHNSACFSLPICFPPFDSFRVLIPLVNHYFFPVVFFLLITPSSCTPLSSPQLGFFPVDTWSCGEFPFSKSPPLLLPRVEWWALWGQAEQNRFVCVIWAFPCFWVSRGGSAQVKQCRIALMQTDLLQFLSLE